MRGGLGCLPYNRQDKDKDKSNEANCADIISKSKYSLKEGLSCILLNAQSIRSKFAELECIVSLDKPDIICITETWMSEVINGDRIQDFELAGYNLFSYSRQTRQGGGVFVYVNSMHSAVIVEDSIKNGLVESVWLDVKVGKKDSDNVRLGTFYRAGNLAKETQDELDQTICDEIRRNFQPKCLIMGDFNLKSYAGTDTFSTCMFKQLFEEELFMQQFVLEPTRINSVLDLVFSDYEELVRDVKVVEGIGNSDHNMVIFNFPSGHRSRANPSRVPDFNKANFDNIRHEIANLDWNTELSDLNVDDAWNVFKARLNQIQSKFIPLKPRRHSTYRRPAWLTAEIKTFIVAKKAAFQKFKESQQEADLEAFQSIRNKVKKEIRAAKRAKEIDMARHCDKDCKKFFSFYKFKTVSKNIGPLKVNDRFVSEDSEIVEHLNDNFQSIFTTEDVRDMQSLQPKLVTQANISDLDEVNSAQVLAQLKKVKPNKAEGPDEIFARLLTECDKELSVPLAIIFTKSLVNSKVPMDWKRANVVPIHKKGDKSVMGNYRPISLTSLVCKILESIIKEKIVEFLECNDIIGDTQHGFRKGRSCLTNLLHFLDVATDSFDQGKQLDVAYLDFSKAFDKVPHQRLVLQLKSHGIEGKILEWIKTWLTGRQQRVVLNGCKSHWKSVISGVPQGSVLGPLLFIIYVNTIDDDIDSRVLKFADDIKVFRVISDVQDQDAFQSDLDKLVQWSEKWQMEFNFTKCKTLHTGHIKSSREYEMKGHKLEEISKETDLGVVITNKLSASDQVLEARRKALRMLGAINKNVSYKSEEVVTKLYNAYVRPHLEYCVQAWSPTYEKDCWLLERVQKRATKMVRGISSLPYEERLERLGLFSLRYRRLRGDMIEIFKFVHGQSKGYLSGMFEFNNTTRVRGHQLRLITKHSRTRLRQSFFSRRAVGHWNKLPSDIISANSLQSFKAKLDVFFKEKGLAFQYCWDS